MSQRSCLRHRATRTLLIITALMAACTEIPPTEPHLQLDPSYAQHGSSEGFPVVIVRPEGATGNGPVVGDLATAVERVGIGGTIRVHPGVYETRDLAITKPLTIVGTGAARPVIDGGGGGVSLSIGPFLSGIVTLRNLRFENTQMSSIFVSGEYDRIVIENSEFMPGSLSGPSGRGYSSGVFAGISSGTELLIRNNEFAGGDIGVNTYGADAVVVRDNLFRDQGNAAVHIGLVGSIRVEGNSIDGCGREWCIGSFFLDHDAVIELLENTIQVDAAQPVVNVMQLHGGSYRIEDNMITGIGGARSIEDAGTWPIQSNAISIDGDASLIGNRISGAHNGLGLGNATVTGTDNVISGVGSVLNLFFATAELHRNDFTDYARALQFVHEYGESSLSCNWWGTPAGPQNLSPGVDIQLVSPWADGPVANGGAGTCAP